MVSGRKRAGTLAMLGLMLAGCSTNGPAEPPTAALAPPPGQGQTQTRAPVKIALLLPMGGMGETAAIAKSMKQGAEMALFELNDPNVELITKDDGGTAARARVAADEAIKEGAEIIVGPLLSQSVQGVAPVARQANVPVLAFSNNTQVAGQGVYLASFLADQEADRIVSYAASQGKRRFAALIPDDAYGVLVEEAFRRSVQANGGTVVVVERYPVTANGMLAPAKRVVEAIKGGAENGVPVDALFLPGGQESLPQIGPVIAYSGLDTTKVKLLGTSAWDFASIGREAGICRRLVSELRPDLMALVLRAFRSHLRHGTAAHGIGLLRRPRRRHRPVYQGPGRPLHAGEHHASRGFHRRRRRHPLQRQRIERARPCGARGAEVRLGGDRPGADELPGNAHLRRRPDRVAAQDSLTP